MKFKAITYLWLCCLLSCLFFSCGDDSMVDDTTVQGTCTDGIQNQDETGVDCGGTCPACPAEALTQKYYIQALQDGEWRTIQSNSEPLCSSGPHACHYFSTTILVSLSGVLNDLSSIEGKTLSMDNSLFEYAHLQWGEPGNPNITSDFVADQSGSFFTIEEFSTQPSAHFGFESYHLKGSFQCKIANQDGSIVHELTDGVFSISGYREL